MSLWGVINKWKTGTYAVTRENITVVDGFGVAGAPTTFNIDASAQPIPGAEIVDNGEGKMVYTKLELWSTSQLQMETASSSPDVITIGGTKYRCIAANYFGILSKHWKMTVEKVDVP